MGEGNSGFYKTAKAILDSTYSESLMIESVYEKSTAARVGTEQELLGKDASTLHSVFDSVI